ncbi:MAG TPA: hypothetical protein ENJ95_10355 [Bacteroidetes bacterium]|nr:hypothetical protein [Bacteroidota bacterium]
MQTFITVILEIVKISVPALIVFFTVYHLMKTYLEKQYQLKNLEYKQGQQKTTIPLRLQAYERLSLFCERIAIPSILLRLREDDQTVAELRLKLLLNIQHEYEYNITQQVYVSDQLWQIIKISRDDTLTIVNGVAEKLDPKSPSSNLAIGLLNFMEKQPVSSLDKALVAIKKEAAILM